MGTVETQAWDHTAEFEAQDIADNKVFAMLSYLIGGLGVIFTFLGAKDSKYAAFHAKESLKIFVLEVLLWLATTVLCWTLIIPFVASIAVLVLFVVRIICCVEVCKGTAKEPVIIRSIAILK